MKYSKHVLRAEVEVDARALAHAAVKVKSRIRCVEVRRKTGRRRRRRRRRKKYSRWARRGRVSRWMTEKDSRRDKGRRDRHDNLLYTVVLDVIGFRYRDVTHLRRVVAAEERQGAHVNIFFGNERLPPPLLMPRIRLPSVVFRCLRRVRTSVNGCVCAYVRVSVPLHAAGGDDALMKLSRGGGGGGTLLSFGVYFILFFFPFHFAAATNDF